MLKYRILGNRAFEIHDFKSFDRAKWFLAGALLQGAAKLESEVEDSIAAAESASLAMADAADQVLLWTGMSGNVFVGGRAYRIVTVG